MAGKNTNPNKNEKYVEKKGETKSNKIYKK